jgi:5'-3' exoribonuclease 2
MYGTEDIGHMYDYVFFCFLLGNDFLPNIASLKIKSGAIDTLCNAYKEVFNGEHIIIKKKELFEINMPVLSKLFENLAKKEDGLMRDATQQYYSSQAQSRSGGKLDRFIAELDSYPTINKFPLVINPAEDSAWKNSYYHHLFGTNQINAIKNFVQNYIEGLSWTMNYYFNKRFDATWYYMYNYSPCISDIYKYIGHANVDLDFTSPSTIDTELQLLMVMPPASRAQVPLDMQKIMDELEYGCAQYYPTRFFLTSYMKSYLWECIPVLPNVDMNALRAARDASTKR